MLRAETNDYEILPLDEFDLCVDAANSRKVLMGKICHPSSPDKANLIFSDALSSSEIPVVPAFVFRQAWIHAECVLLTSWKVSYSNSSTRILELDRHPVVLCSNDISTGHKHRRLSLRHTDLAENVIPARRVTCLWAGYWDQIQTKHNPVLEDLVALVVSKSVLSESGSFVVETVNPCRTSEKLFVVFKKSPGLYWHIRVNEHVRLSNFKISRLFPRSLRQRIVLNYVPGMSSVDPVFVDLACDIRTFNCTPNVQFSGKITAVSERGLIELDGQFVAVLSALGESIVSLLRVGQSISLFNVHVCHYYPGDVVFVGCVKSSIQFDRFGDLCAISNVFDSCRLQSAAAILWRIENSEKVASLLNLPTDSKNIVAKKVISKVGEMFENSMKESQAGFYASFFDHEDEKCISLAVERYPILVSVIELIELENFESIYTSPAAKIRLGKVGLRKLPSSVLSIGLLRGFTNFIFELADSSGKLMLRSRDYQRRPNIEMSQIGCLWSVGISDLYRETVNGVDNLVGIIDWRLTHPMFQLTKHVPPTSQSARVIVFINQVSRSSSSMPTVIRLGWVGRISDDGRMISQSVLKAVLLHGKWLQWLPLLSCGQFYELFVEARDILGTVILDSRWILAISKLCYSRQAFEGASGTKIALSNDDSAHIAKLIQDYCMAKRVHYVFELLQMQLHKSDLTDGGFYSKLISVAGVVDCLELRRIDPENPYSKNTDAAESSSCPFSLCVSLKESGRLDLFHIYVDLDRHLYPHGVFPGDHVIIRDFALRFSNKNGCYGVYQTCSSIEPYLVYSKPSAHSALVPDLSAENRSVGSISTSEARPLFDAAQEGASSVIALAEITGIESLEFVWRCKVCGGEVNERTCASQCFSRQHESLALEDLNLGASCQFFIDDGTVEASVTCDASGLVFELTRIDRELAERIRKLAYDYGKLSFHWDRFASFDHNSLLDCSVACEEGPEEEPDLREILTSHLDGMNSQVLLLHLALLKPFNKKALQTSERIVSGVKTRTTSRLRCHLLAINSNIS